MPDVSKYPVDHARTTRQHAGESMKNGANAPGLIAIGVGLVALSAGLFALATGYALLGTVAVVLAVVLGGGGLVWLALAHRKVREVENQWHAEHPEAPKGPPTS